MAETEIHAPNLLKRVQGFLFRGLWAAELEELPLWRSVPLRLARSAVLAGLHVREHELGIRAAALAFTTVLSLVPMLAFAFAISKGFGLYDSLIAEVVQPFLDQNFGPAGEGGGLGTLPGARAAQGPAAGESAFLAVEPPAQAVPIPALDSEAGSGLPGGSVAPETPGEAAPAVDSLQPVDPVPAQSTGVRQAADAVLKIVEATPVTGLGVFGLFVLVGAVLRLLTQVEQALNRIHGVSRPRHLIRRLTDYLAILLFAPVLALAATAVKASSQSQTVLDSVRSVEGVGHLLDALISLGPLFVMWVVFSLLYVVMPNTRVRPFSAILGGFFAALLWFLVQELYVKAQLGVSSYNQLYAGFAALPLFLLWLFLSWMSVLLGAEFGNADQCQAAFRHQALFAGASQAAFEATVLRAVLRIAESFESGQRPPTVSRLVDDLDVPRGRLIEDFERLEAAGLLLQGDADGGLIYALGRPPDRIRIAELLLALRGQSPDPQTAGPIALDQRLLAGMRGLEAAMVADGGNQTLRELVQQGGGEPRSGAAPGPLAQAPRGPGPARSSPRGR